MRLEPLKEDFANSLLVDACWRRLRRIAGIAGRNCDLSRTPSQTKDRSRAFRQIALSSKFDLAAALYGFFGPVQPSIYRAEFSAAYSPVV